MPVPVMVMALLPAGTLSNTVSVALRKPIAVGVKVAVIVQLAFTARLLGEIGQVLVCAKSPALAPLIARLVMNNGPVPLLVSVMFIGALVVLSVMLPKLKL